MAEENIIYIPIKRFGRFNDFVVIDKMKRGYKLVLQDNEGKELYRMVVV